MATNAELALQRSRDAQKKAQDLALLEAQRLAAEQKNTVMQQAEGLAQEAFVSKKQQERTLPNVMAQSGLSGQGYTETTANAIGTSYSKAWNEIMKNRATSLSGIDSNVMGAQSTINQNKAKIDADYEANLANYQAQIEAARQRSSSSGSTKLSATEKKNQTLTYEGQAMEALNGFAWNPQDPVTSRANMETYLQPFLTNKYLTYEQIQGIIDDFMAKYANRSQVSAMGATRNTKNIDLNK